MVRFVRLHHCRLHMIQSTSKVDLAYIRTSTTSTDSPPLVIAATRQPRHASRVDNPIAAVVLPLYLPTTPSAQLLATPVAEMF